MATRRIKKMNAVMPKTITKIEANPILSIVSREVFQAVQSEMARRTSKHTSDRNSEMNYGLFCFLNTIRRKVCGRKQRSKFN